MEASELRRMAVELLKIRYFEESLDDLFSKGIIRGTFHRCIGQEASALALTDPLDRQRDFVISNHRNHGHYLAFTGDYKGLLEELKGTEKGVTGGLGGSQVIIGERFLSNGILGSTVPIATGIAFGQKLRGEGITLCYLGDGCLNQGNVYEAFNMAALWKLPIFYAVEFNKVAQSADIDRILAGTIRGRFEAFGIPCWDLDGANLSGMTATALELVGQVRSGCCPLGVIVNVERLCAHSKGDEERQITEAIRARDPWLRISQELGDEPIKVQEEARRFIEELIASQ